ncbi:hypothetical protein MSAN_01166500 [Mycena sanguinolenta]|uniref:C2H2-type domain-containing protein n=1 Tax=Mycena sanguinolenta TaxID=230812 RepID=A0A8H6YHI8_9AGAR|nr:hypothetical protein MSAN_01166500 [Mycena sanguinolenta]
MSHPIALPVAAHQDYSMDAGSYTGENGQFNPASYTRHFLGSPISWRAGSFGAQFVPSQSPTAMLVGSYEHSAVKSPDSSILNAWNVFDRQGELCRNYTCCGNHLADLHALLEHFEEVHIVVKDRNQPSIQIPFNPQMSPPEPEPPQMQPQLQYSTPFDTDDMDLGLDYDNASSPPLSTAPTSAVTSRAPSPSPSPTGSSRPALNISLNSVGFPFREHTPLSAARAAPFSAYARYNAEYNSPGAVTPQDVAGEYTPDPSAIATSLVFATGEELQGDSTGSNQPSPTTTPAAPVPAPSTSSASGKAPKASSKRSPPPTSSSSVPPSRGHTPSATPLPTPPCERTCIPCASHDPPSSQAIPYHMTHGSCNYGPAKDLEAVRALLERKRAANAAQPAYDDEAAEDAAPTPASAAGEQQQQQLSQAELNEVEARVRPFACGVGDCTRRYKNMNGLRYHYQHSGDHGAAGLQALAAGLHPCLQQRQNSTSTVTTPSTYAWGSTLLPHIQAVATTTKAKTEATPFTPPSSTTTSVSAPATPTATLATAAAFTPGQQAQTPNDYLAQLQRAQFAQYHQWCNSNNKWMCRWGSALVRSSASHFKNQAVKIPSPRLVAVLGPVPPAVRPNPIPVSSHPRRLTYATFSSSPPSLAIHP